MNIAQMYNLIGTLIDEHRTVRWEDDDKDDLINFVIKKYVDDSIDTRGSVSDKFEVERRIRQNLYTLLLVNEPWGPVNLNICNHNALPSAATAHRYIVRLNARFFKPGATAVLTDVIATVPSTTTITIALADLSVVTVGDYMLIRGSYYKISVIDNVGKVLTTEDPALATAIIPTDAVVIYPGNETSIDLDYVERNAYNETIIKDPYAKPNVGLGIYPVKAYYSLHDQGIEVFPGDLGGYVAVLITADLLKVPTTVSGGIEYTTDDANLPGAGTAIALTEFSHGAGPTIAQPGATVACAGQAINYGSALYSYVNCDLPDSIHEDICIRTANIMNSVPNEQARAKLLAQMGNIS